MMKILVRKHHKRPALNAERKEECDKGVSTPLQKRDDTSALLSKIILAGRPVSAIPLVQLSPEKGDVQHIAFELEVPCPEIVLAYSEVLYKKILARLEREKAWPAGYEREALAREFSFEIMDEVHRKIPVEAMTNYRYQLQLWLPAGKEPQSPHSLQVTLISPKTVAAEQRRGEAQEIEGPFAMEEGRQSAASAMEKGPEQRHSAEQVKAALADVDDALGDLGAILLWAERMATDGAQKRMLRNLRNELERVHEPLSKAMKVERMATRTARLVFAIKQAARYDAGSREAVEAVAGLAEPVGELAKAMAEWAPPGVSHFLEALGEAGKGFPRLVRDVKEAMKPTTERRRAERGYVIP